MTIRNNTGAPIPGVSITSGDRVVDVTDSAGNFVINNLLYGRLQERVIFPDSLYRYLHDGDTVYHLYIAPVEAKSPEKSQDYQAATNVISDSFNPFLNLKVHTNLPYMAALAFNGGLEMSFGKEWSMGADGYVAWLRNQSKDVWWEFYGFDLYGRYWFGRGNTQPLRGFHAGFYLGTLTYDLYPTSNTGYQCDKMFHTYRFGGEFGYSADLTKKNRNWRIDFYVGLGLLHTRQDVYKNRPSGGYYIKERRRRTLPDFTRFGITIGYVFGQKKK